MKKDSFIIINYFKEQLLIKDYEYYNDFFNDTNEYNSLKSEIKNINKLIEKISYNKKAEETKTYFQKETKILIISMVSLILLIFIFNLLIMYNKLENFQNKTLIISIFFIIILCA